MATIRQPIPNVGHIPADLINEFPIELIDNYPYRWDEDKEIAYFPTLGLVYDPIMRSAYPVEDYRVMCNEEIEIDELDGAECFDSNVISANGDTDDYSHGAVGDNAMATPSGASDAKIAVKVEVIGGASTATSSKATTVYEKEEIFSSGLTVSEDIKVVVHQEILDACRDIYKQVDRDEFSILTKGYWSENMWYTTNEFVIPKQEVGYTSVDYDLDDLHTLKQQGFNTVIHGHPVGSKAFSGDDMKYINAHFDCSVLFCETNFVTSCMPIKVTDDFLLQVTPTSIGVYNPTAKKVEVSLVEEKITRKKTVTPYTNYGSKYGYWKDGKYHKYADDKKNTGARGVNRAEDWDNLTDEEYCERIQNGNFWGW